MIMHNKDLHIEICGDDKEIAIVKLTRPAKRNALSDGLILAIRDAFDSMPSTVRAAVIDGEGDHFCAGLDLSELTERDAGQGLHHSRMWHAALERVQYGPVPVIAALHGAVVGGGLELASACHIRVADGKHFLCPARRQPWHLCGWRWRGAHPTPDWSRANDRHDADRGASTTRHMLMTHPEMKNKHIRPALSPDPAHFRSHQ
jgi:hypothetical protein